MSRVDIAGKRFGDQGLIRIQADACVSGSLKLDDTGVLNRGDLGGADQIRKLQRRGTERRWNGKELLLIHSDGLVPGRFTAELCHGGLLSECPRGQIRTGGSVNGNIDP
jgi:hypothetical protein